MSPIPELCIPSSTRRWLEEIPKDSPVALLLRHSTRGPLTPGEAGDSVPITEAGERLAEELGFLLGSRLRTLHTSPIARCLQTAEALRRGANASLPILLDRHLGDPGVFVIDAQRAWQNWKELGHEGVMQHLVSSNEALPGMAPPDRAARFLVQHMLGIAGEYPGLHVFVTHDSLVTATVARLKKQALGPDAWPDFLEGAFFWKDKTGIQLAYRNAQHYFETLHIEKLAGRL